MGRRTPTQAERLAAQGVQYELPYHHLPRLYHWHHLIEYQVYLREVIREVHRLAPFSLLDVGCGDGRLLTKLGFGVGVDLDARAIRWAQAVGVNAWCADAASLTEKFDLVTAIEVLEHIPLGGTMSFVKTLADRSKGKVLLTVPTTNAKQPLKHFRHYTERTLRNVVEPYLEVESIRWIIRQPWWWTLAERVPSQRHEGWLRDQLVKRVDADASNGRHLLLIGRPR